MDLVDGLADLPHNEGNAGLGEGLGFFELVVELPARTDLENDVDVGCVMEAAVHFDDVGVVEEHLDFDLTDELVSDLLLMDQLLFDNLQRTDEVRILLLHQVNPSIFTVSQLFQLREVIHGHFSGFCFRRPPEISREGQLFGQMGSVGLESGLDHLTAFHVQPFLAAEERWDLGSTVLQLLISALFFVKVAIFWRVEHIQLLSSGKKGVLRNVVYCFAKPVLFFGGIFENFFGRAKIFLRNVDIEIIIDY